MNENLGENLIFLISQPRSGSTLLQRMLSVHPKIHTAAETWLLLYPFYALKHTSLETEYDFALSKQATTDFLNSLPNGLDEYYSGIRRMALYLYEQELANSNKIFFLDKTPRYYLVIPEIIKAFPKAKIILLLRNPLAVFVSIVNTWSIFILYRFRVDLIQAPLLIASALRQYGDKMMVVHYEDLVNNPYTILEKICLYLNIDFVPGMIEYGEHDTKANDWKFGDKEGIHNFKRPEKMKSEEWISSIKKPQIWHLMNDYLKIFSPEIFEIMGYSYSEFITKLRVAKPSHLRILGTLPLSWLLKSSGKHNSAFRNRLARISKSIQRRGWFATIAKGIKLVAGNKDEVSGN